MCKQKIEIIETYAIYSFFDRYRRLSQLLLNRCVYQKRKKNENSSFGISLQLNCREKKPRKIRN